MLALLALSFILAQAAHPDVMLNKNEFSPVLLGQIIQIIITLGAAAGGWAALRRRPPVTEELVALKLTQANHEQRLQKIEERLQDGEEMFGDGKAAAAAMREAIQAMKEDMHIIKQQVASLLPAIHHLNNGGNKRG